MNYEDKLVNKAFDIAKEAHKGQKRNKTGEPYLVHPTRMEKTFKEYPLKVVALLHDVIEDSEFTSKDLLDRGIPYRLIARVELLTRPSKKVPYVKYIKNILKDEMATKVKYADLNDNLRDLERGNLRDKYELTKYVLEQAYPNLKEVVKNEQFKKQDD